MPRPIGPHPRAVNLHETAPDAFVEADFRASWVTDSDLERVAAMPDLQRIDLSHTRITDIGFEHLKKLQKVQSVNLYYAEQIGDGALAAMKNWRQLRELNLRGRKLRMPA